MEQKGKRFSLVYLERGALARDSQRFRNRLAAYFSRNLFDSCSGSVGMALKINVGIEVPRYPNRQYAVPEVFRKGELRDVLDAVTIVYNELRSKALRRDADDWIFFVEKALREENVGYTVDDQGGVHYYVDEEFERNRVSALAVLEQPRYAGVRAALEDAYRHMDSDPPDTKASVRSVFEALEILVKQMVKTNNLNRSIVQNALKDQCQVLFHPDPIGAKVVGELFDSFALWVNALHNYRHGQLSEDPVAPDGPLCVHIISTGCSYIRWLAQLDGQLNAPDDET